MALAYAVRDRDERNGWTATHELLAQVVEWLSVIRVEALALGGVKQWKLPDVHRVSRPGDTEEGKVVMTPREFALAMAA